MGRAEPRPIVGGVPRTGRKRKSGRLDAPCPMWAACGGQALCPCSVAAATDYRGNWLELSFQLPRTIVTNATQCLRPILRGQSPLLKNPLEACSQQLWGVAFPLINPHSYTQPLFFQRMKRIGQMHIRVESNSLKNGSTDIVRENPWRITATD